MGAKGLGSALRKVRERRGVSLLEAARDTRIRVDHLEAIEAEEYERLLGDVHVRACLRTYATYLGISPERVLELYGAHGAPPAPPRLVSDPEIRLPRRRDDARLLVMVAAAVLVLAAAFGVLSARDPAPEPAAPPASAAAALAEVAPPGIEVAVLAREPVEVTVVIDGGEPETYALRVGEGRSFAAAESLRLRLSRGLTAQVTVNGKDLGMPGRPGRPWSSTWRYGTASGG